MSEHESGWTEQTPTRWHWRSVGRVVLRGACHVRRGPADDDEEPAPPETPPRPAPEPKRPTFRDRAIEKREG